MYDGFVFLRTARRSFDGDALHCETFKCCYAMCVRSSVMWLYLFRLMRVPAGCATLCVLWFCRKFRRLCATSVISHSHILSAGGGWHKCHCDCCRLLPCCPQRCDVTAFLCGKYTVGAMSVFVLFYENDVYENMSESSPEVISTKV